MVLADGARTTVGRCGIKFYTLDFSQNVLASIAQVTLESRHLTPPRDVVTVEQQKPPPDNVSSKLQAAAAFSKLTQTWSSPFRRQGSCELQLLRLLLNAADSGLAPPMKPKPYTTLGCQEEYLKGIRWVKSPPLLGDRTQTLVPSAASPACAMTVSKLDGGQASTCLCDATPVGTAFLAKHIASPLRLRSAAEISVLCKTPRTLLEEGMPPVVFVGTGAGLGAFAGYLHMWDDPVVASERPFCHATVYAGARYAKEVRLRYSSCSRGTVMSWSWIVVDIHNKNPPFKYSITTEIDLWRICVSCGDHSTSSGYDHDVSSVYYRLNDS